MVAAVIDQEDLDRHPVMDDGLQLLQVHLNASVTGYKNNIMAAVAVSLMLRVVSCHAGADRRRQVVAHRCDRGIG